MKLTTKGRYAVMAMADLASYSREKPVSLSEISARQNISLAYLEQLFLRLKNKKLVKVLGDLGVDMFWINPLQRLNCQIFFMP